MDNITDEIRLADMTETSNEASFHKPTRRERFWRAIGFRYHFTDLPEGIHEGLGEVVVHVHCWRHCRPRLDGPHLDRARNRKRAVRRLARDAQLAPEEMQGVRGGDVPLGRM